MIEILIPTNNSNEINYIVNVLFGEFLGLEYKIITNDTKDYQIKFNNKTLTINNDFFGRFKSDVEYLKKENLPETISLTKNKFTPELDIPLIYGNDKIRIENDSIYCGIDIFASSFLLLSRWEEYVIEEKDEHDRFPSKLSILQNNNLHLRPIVNEYLEFLWNMLIHLGYNGKRKKYEYKLRLTHDIDWFYKYRNFNKYIRALGGDIVKRKNPLLLFKTTYEYFFSKMGIIKDPYDTYDKLMDISEEKGTKSTFFFMASELSNFDVAYNISDKKVLKTINQITERAHNIEIHGSYNSSGNKELLESEVKELKKITDNISACRQHFLRFNNPNTWQMYEDIGFKSDFNIGFENEIGFRSGTCYSYSVFNILTRKQLNLQTEPFLIMDSTYFYNKQITKKQFEDNCKTVIERVKKYNGTMQIIWHNNSPLKFYKNYLMKIV